MRSLSFKQFALLAATAAVGTTTTTTTLAFVPSSMVATRSTSRHKDAIADFRLSSTVEKRPEAEAEVEDEAAGKKKSLPKIIQGGMGIRISSWQLAREVARKGGLGVISGTAMDVVFVRTLQDGESVSQSWSVSHSVSAVEKWAFVLLILLIDAIICCYRDLLLSF